MSSCSGPVMNITISCSSSVLDSADGPIISSGCENINEMTVPEETSNLDSSNKLSNEEALRSPNLFALEDEDPQLMTCSHAEATQNISGIRSEDVEEVDSEDAVDANPCRLVDFKSQITVDRRTAIVTRLDGVNLSTGSDVSFYKCHLCGKLFGRLADVPMHLSAVHSPQQMTLYQCLICDSSFSFKTKLVQHLKMHHDVTLPRRVETSGAEGFSVPTKGPLGRNSGVPGGSDCCPKIISSSAELCASSEAPAGLEIDESKTDEESGLSSASQFEMQHLSVDRIPEDQNRLDELGLDKLSDGCKGLFRCNPVKGLTKTNSFLCQICGFESWRQQRLLHHVIKHHLDSVAVQKMRRQLLHRRKHQFPHRTSESNLLRKFGNIREFKAVVAETGNCLPSSVDESCPVAFVAPNVERIEEPLSLSVSHRTTDCFSQCLDDVLAIRPDSVSNKADDMHESSSAHFSESCDMNDEIEDENLLTTPVSAMSTETKNAVDNMSIGSGSPPVSMHMSSSICSTTSSLPDSVIPTSSSVMTMSSLIMAHNAESGCKPVIFNPSDISPLLRNFLPLPLLSLFVSQSALNPASFLGASNSNSQFPSDQVKISQQSFNDKFSSSLASQPWDQSPEFEGTGEEDIKPSRAVLDWRMMVRNRTRGLASRGSSTLHAKFNAGSSQDQSSEIFKPIVTSDGQAVYRCTYCSKDFSTASDITRHMEFHEDIRPYRCTHCDYHARTNSQLKVHMMRHQGIRKFHCRLCNYKGVTQSDLNRHAKSQIHLLKARNQCESCGEGFVSPINLGKHYHERHFGQKAGEDLELDH